MAPLENASALHGTLFKQAFCGFPAFAARPDDTGPSVCFDDGGRVDIPEMGVEMAELRQDQAQPAARAACRDIV